MTPDINSLFDKFFPREPIEPYVDEAKKLITIERKLDIIIAMCERIEKWLDPQFDEEGNVIK